MPAAVGGTGDRTGFLDRGGARIHYSVRGGATPTVVLLHGAFCSSADWVYQVRDLCGEFTVAAVDLRGHGRSTAPFATCTIEHFAADIIALVRARGWAPAVLVGHSLATRAVLEAAVADPAAVAALVLLDGSRAFGQATAAESPGEPTAEKVALRLGAIIDGAVGPFATPAVAAHIRATMSSAPADLVRAFVATSQDWDANRFDTVVANLPPGLPVLAIQSTYFDHVERRSLTADVATTPYLDELRRHLPDLQTVILPDRGHFSMLETPDRVTRLIGEFARAHCAPAKPAGRSTRTSESELVEWS